MKKTTWFRWLIITIAIFPSNGLAQELQYSNYTVREGLPSPETYAVFQDSLGYIWVGTDRGLSVYDGYKFKTYTTANSDLTGNTIFRIDQAPNGELWFSCYNGSITIFNQSTRTFRPFAGNDSLQKWCSYWTMTLAFRNDIVQIFNYKETNSFAEYNMITGKISRRSFEEFDWIKHPVPGAGNYSRLFNFYTPKEGEDFFQPLVANCHGCQMNKPHSEKSLFENICSRGETIFFYHFEHLFALHDGVFRHIREFPSSINRIQLDHSKRLIVLTDDGFYIESENEFKHYFPGRGFTWASQDFEGNYWLTTKANGLYRIPNPDIRLHDNEFLKGNQISAMKAFGGELVLGTRSENILILNGSGELKPLKNRFAADDEVAGRLHIEGLVEDGGSLYTTGPFRIESRNDGLVINRIAEFQRMARSIVPISHGRYVAVGYHPGYYVVYPSGKDSLVDTGNDLYNCLDKDGDGMVWAGGLGGLWKIDPNHPFDPQKQTQRQELLGRINCILHTKQNVKVVGSGVQGVVLIYPDSGCISLNTDNGLISNVVNTLAYESDSIIWVGTNKGISRVKIGKHDPYACVLRNLNEDDGIPSSFTYSLAVWHGKLYVGTDEGLYTISLNDIDSTPNRPQMILEEVLVAQSNEVTSFSDQIFRYDQNDISIRYVGISFNKPEEGFYRYRLIYNGENESTRYTVTDNVSADFFNLVPGDYEFEIACRNKNNVWSETRTYSFTIVPHYTDTLWFKILTYVAIVVVVLLLVLWRNREVKRHNRSESQLKELEYRFKESELAVLRNQMNPHFVFNALNSIQSYVLENDIATASGYIQKFSLLMRSSLEYSMDDLISLSKEVEFLTNYLQIEKLRFPDRFDYEINVVNVDDMESIYLPPLLIQPIAENCVKHAFEPDETSGRIRITFELLDKTLKCTVEDNGVGIDLKKTTSVIEHRSYGIQVVKNRLELLSNNDFRLTLTMVDLRREYPERSGTRVTIIIPIE